ncbi:MAG: TrmH family RNA methyltransferase [Micrococcales bacterium]
MLIDPKAAEVRRVAQLAKKDARSETGLFLLEGVQGLREIEPSLVKALYATEECVEKYSDLFTGLSYVLVSDRVLEAMCDTKTPQGVVAVCKQFDVSLSSVIASGPRLVAVLSQVRDPGNAGTVLRAADAAGADAVIFSSSSVDVYNPKTVRSTAGSLFHVPFVVDVDVLDAISSLQAAGIQVFAADGGGDSILDVSLDAPTAWVFGNEAWGFESDVLAAVDRVVGLPIYGEAESLNLATAASVCLYESAFAQRK